MISVLVGRLIATIPYTSKTTGEDNGETAPSPRFSHSSRTASWPIGQSRCRIPKQTLHHLSWAWPTYRSTPTIPAHTLVCSIIYGLPSRSAAPVYWDTRLRFGFPGGEVGRGQSKGRICGYGGLEREHGYGPGGEHGLTQMLKPRCMNQSRRMGKCQSNVPALTRPSGKDWVIETRGNLGSEFSAVSRGL